MNRVESLLPAPKEIFSSALAIDDPAERQSYVETTCGLDLALRQRILAMLAASRAADGPLDQWERAFGPDVTLSPTTVFDLALDSADHPEIGPYKLLERIGEGGMGVVYMAQQTHPVKRRVALKVIKPGMDSQSVIARFEAERQAIAMMDHPNIAKLLDAGSTPQGYPYFVMELVAGVPITEYCDQARLNPRQRLQLMVTVCQAVQHAHQKGIIHRDLKPSNVLVTLHDGVPVPKVIDFGLAKAMHQELTDRTLFTRFAQMLGTPMYMSPEQAELSGLDVDTRSDVYSLGVLTYELLTGQTPFDKKSLKHAGLDEVRRIIRDQDPPRPGKLLDTLDACTVSTLSQKRSIDERQLRSLLRGELDWIVMKAIDKDRNRRYESASALATDIGRYLASEAVQACPPSIPYRMRKYAIRHKVLLTTSALLVAMLSASTIVSTMFGFRAQRSALQANEAKRVANQHEEAAISAKVIADQRLAQSRVDFDRALASLDLIVSEVSSAEFAQLQDAEEIRARIFEKAMQFYREIVDGHDRDSYARLQQAIAHLRIATIKGLMYEHESQLLELNQAIAIAEELLEDKPDEIAYLEVLGSSLFHRMHSPLRTPEEHLADAEQHLSLGRTASALGCEAATRAMPMSLFKVADSLPEGSPRAHELIQESIQFSEEHGLPVTAPVHTWLGKVAWNANELESAIDHYRKGVEAFRKMAIDLNQEQPFIQLWLAAFVLNDIAQVYEQAGKLADAEVAHREAFEDALQNDQANSAVFVIHEAVRLHAIALSSFLIRQRRFDEASEVVRRAVKQAPDLESLHAIHISILTQTEDPIARLTSEIEQFSGKDQIPYLTQRAILNGERGDTLGQRQDLEAAVAIEPDNARVLNNVAWFLSMSDQPTAEDLQQAVLFATKAIELSPDDGNYWNTLGVAQYRVGDDESAIASLQRSIELNPKKAVYNFFVLAMTHARRGKTEEAVSSYELALAELPTYDFSNRELKRIHEEAEALMRELDPERFRALESRNVGSSPVP